MFKLLILLALTFGFCGPIFAGGFVEAQVKYKVLDNGKKDFSYRWDAASNHGFLHLGLDWFTFRDDWHTGGFNLSNSHSIYISFPELPAECKIANHTGVLFDIYQKGYSYFDIILKGKGCENADRGFELLDATITVYGLSPFRGSNPPDVLRIMIFDHNK